MRFLSAGRLLATALAGAIVAFEAALAGPIVNVGDSWTMTFRAGFFAQAAASVSNVGDGMAEFNGVAMAYVLVPVSGSGELTIADFTAPATNPLFTQDPPEYYLFAQSQLDAPITVSGIDYYDYYPVFAANTTSYNEQLAPSETKNFGTLTFSASAGTEGIWQVYLANQESPQKTFYSTAAPLADFTFSDLPAANGSMVLVGTVNVVPEPSTMAGLSAGGVAFAAAALGRRRRKQPARPA